MIAGYTVTQDRATYTCIGDTVNLAARLEAHTKMAGNAILIDKNTSIAIAQRLPTSALGPIVFKDKSGPVEVFVLQARS